MCLAPSPPPPPPPEPEDPQVQDAARDERRRQRLTAGRESTIRNSSLGASVSASTQRKTLLGQ